MAFGDVLGTLKQRQRKSGKMYYSATFKSDRLAINTDERSVARPVAEAIAAWIKDRIASIPDVASARTQKARKVAAKAFAEGKSWARRSYAGGRIGDTPPNQSPRLFNDSGRFVKSIVAGWSNLTKAWTINFAANRLNPSIIGEAGVQRIYARLQQLVDFGEIVNSLPVRKAVSDALQKAIKIRKASQAALLFEAAQEGAETASDVEDVVEEEAG